MSICKHFPNDTRSRLYEYHDDHLQPFGTPSPRASPGSGTYDDQLARPSSSRAFRRTTVQPDGPLQLPRLACWPIVRLSYSYKVSCCSSVLLVASTCAFDSFIKDASNAASEKGEQFFGFQSRFLDYKERQPSLGINTNTSIAFIHLTTRMNKMTQPQRTRPPDFPNDAIEK
jgi:hypothetical protein